MYTYLLGVLLFAVINSSEFGTIIKSGSQISIIDYRALSYTRSKKFSVKIMCKKGWACKMYRNKEGMKAQEDYPAAGKSW